MAVYLREALPTWEAVISYISTGEHSSVDRICTIISHCLAHPESGEQGAERLGISARDHSAKQWFHTFLTHAKGGHLTVVPMTSDETIYLIRNGESPVAVFKVGHQRTAIETSMRKLACALGLEKYVTPGFFCAFEGLPIRGFDLDRDVEGVIEGLYNGVEKLYLVEKDAAMRASAKVVGIVEPYFPTAMRRESDAELYAYLCLVVLSLAMGLRDAKDDGIFWRDGEEGFYPVLVDHEDAMPETRYDEAAVMSGEAETEVHLPFLSNPLTLHSIPEDVKIRLIRHVQEYWKDIFSIVMEVCSEEVIYVDRVAESQRDTEEFRDEGGARVELSDVPDIDSERGEGKPLWSAPQRDLLCSRLYKLLDAIVSGRFTTAFDLVSIVDPLYAKWLEATLSAVAHPDSPDSPGCLSRQVYDAASAYWRVGTRSPNDLGVALPPGCVELVIAAMRSSPRGGVTLVPPFAVMSPPVIGAGSSDEGDEEEGVL